MCQLPKPIRIFSADTERTFAWLQLTGMATTVVTASARLNGLLVAIS
jgi:hypothetical protein